LAGHPHRQFKSWKSNERLLCLPLGISDSKLHGIIALYNEKGASFCAALKWGGRREKRCLLSFEQEEELLQNRRQAAVEAEVLVAKQLRAAVEQKAGAESALITSGICSVGMAGVKKHPDPNLPKQHRQKRRERLLKKNTCLLLFKPYSKATESFL
jgi:hypothetical protein